jgi:translation initiation factor IF-2
VVYGSADIARRFGGNTAGDRNRANLNFRGSNGAQVVKPNAGNKPINRANAISGGNRANAKLSAGARAKGTHRGVTNVHARTLPGSHAAHVGGGGRPGGGRSLAVSGGGGRAHGGGGGRGGGRRR